MCVESACVFVGVRVRESVCGQPCCMFSLVWTGVYVFVSCVQQVCTQKITVAHSPCLCVESLKAQGRVWTEETVGVLTYNGKTT